MNLELVLERVAQERGSPEALRLAALAMGGAFSRPSEQATRELAHFEASLARLDSQREGSPGAQAASSGAWSEGFTSALLTVLSGYLKHRRQLEEEEASRGEELTLSDDWKKLLLSLREGPIRPKAIVGQLDMDKGQVSRNLRAMSARHVGLVENLRFGAEETSSEDVSSPTGDGRARVYRLTLKGEQVANKLHEEQQRLASQAQRTSLRKA